MNTMLADALHADSAVAPELGDIAAEPSRSPLEDWPEQAIDACAPEGGYSPYVSAAHSRTTEPWS